MDNTVIGLSNTYKICKEDYVSESLSNSFSVEENADYSTKTSLDRIKEKCQELLDNRDDLSAEDITELNRIINDPR